MSEYIPNPMYAQDVPIDLRGVFADERPAGRHGFMRAEGGSFVFADGTPARFWGTNFNGGACFPEHAYAEKLAVRLANAGLPADYALIWDQPHSEADYPGEVLQWIDEICENGS